MFPKGHSVHPHLPHLPLEIGCLHSVSPLKLPDHAARVGVLLGYSQQTPLCVDRRKKLLSVYLKGFILKRVIAFYKNVLLYLINLNFLGLLLECVRVRWVY